MRSLMKISLIAIFMILALAIIPPPTFTQADFISLPVITNDLTINSPSSITATLPVTVNLNVDATADTRTEVVGSSEMGAVPISQAPELTIDKTVSHPEGITDVPLGSTITYTIILSNSGDESAEDVVVIDELPAGLNFGAWVFTGSAQLVQSSNVITWGPHDIAQQTDTTVVFTAIVGSEDDLYSQTITNSARFSSTNAGSGSDEAIFTVTSAKVYLPVLLSPNLGCPTVPSLISPINGENVNTLIPTLTWDSGNDPQATAAQIEIKEVGSSSFSNPQSEFWKTGVHSYEPSGNLEKDKTYSWRVRLLCGATLGDYSPEWTFTPVYDGPVLPAPQLISPADESILNSTTVTLQWSAVPGAIGYTVYRGESGFPVFFPFITTPTTEVTYDFDGDTTHLWKVVARDDKAYGPESETWEFTTP